MQSWIIRYHRLLLLVLWAVLMSLLLPHVLPPLIMNAVIAVTVLVIVVSLARRPPHPINGLPASLTGLHPAAHAGEWRKIARRALSQHHHHPEKPSSRRSKQ